MLASWTCKSSNKERFGKDTREALRLQNSHVTSDVSCEPNVTFPHTDTPWTQHEDGQDRNRNMEHL